MESLSPKAADTQPIFRHGILPSGATRNLLLLVVLSMLQGCVTGTSPSPRYYRMDSLLDSNQPPELRLQQYDFLLGIGPLSLADYLDRPQIMKRRNGHQMQVSEFDRWSGSLQDDFETVLTENLRALLGNDKVIAHPWPRSAKPDYHISLKVSRFDAEPAQVVLRTSWLISTDQQRKLLAIRAVEIRETANGDDYESLVAAHSRAVQKLSRSIVDALAGIVQ